MDEEPVGEESLEPLTSIEKLKRGDASADTFQGVLAELHLSKARERTPSRTRDNRTGKQVYKDASALPSMQLSGDPFKEMASGEYLEPSHNPEVYAATVENNTRLGRSIRTYARNTLGLGWRIEAKVKETKDTNSKVVEEIKRQTAILEHLFSNPNDEMPTNSLFYNMKIDEETTGNGYVEVVRNDFGIVTNLYHVPSITVRKRVQNGEGGDREVNGYVQIQGNEKVYFKEFGDERHMSASTGKYYDNPEEIEDGDGATELIHFRLYSPLEHWYGAPRYVSATPAIIGNRYAATRNVKFFENDAVPRMAIMVSGGKFDAKTLQQIEDYFKGKSMGLDKSHNCLVIQADSQAVGYDKSPNPSIDLKPLTVGVTEDASFQTYREANDEEIRECFGIGQVFFASDSTNRASAATSREITNEQEFEPDRLEKEYLINQKLVPSILHLPVDDILVTFRFERMKLTDPLDLARMDQTYAALGALTPNELRASIGKDPYPEDYAFANKPIQVSMAQMTLHHAEAIKHDWNNEASYMKKMARVQQQSQPQGGMPGMDGMPGMEPDGGDEMGIDALLGGLGDEQGEAEDQENKGFDADNTEHVGEHPKSYGSIELMKALNGVDRLPEEKKILLSLLLKTLM